MELNPFSYLYPLDIIYPLNLIFKSNIYNCKCLIILFILQISVVSDGDPCIYAMHRCRDLQRMQNILKVLCDICYSICYVLYFCIFFLRFSFRCLLWFRRVLWTL